jgi:tRNA(Ile)-lysidine synthase
MSSPGSIMQAIAVLPPGRYAVAVSGGSDSTALACLLADRPDLTLHLVHLNYQLRGPDSDGDEAFVIDLARRLNRPLIVRRAIDLPALPHPPTNPQAAYRAQRLEVLKQVAADHQLDAVVMAHHREDVAETVLLRLLRGGGLITLTGIRAVSQIGSLTIHRPLLEVGKADLQRYLQSIHQPWREDASNASPLYRRNIVRRFLQSRPALVKSLVTLAAKAADLRDQLEAAAPALDGVFAVETLRALPPVVAEQAVRRWLVARGAPPDAVSPIACQRMIRQALDTAAPPRQHYPGGLLVRRRQKRMDLLWPQ